MSIHKLDCYVDESGLALGGQFFIVVTIILGTDREEIRKELEKIEKDSKKGLRKWHKSKPERGIAYLKAVINKDLGKGQVFFAKFQKPTFFFSKILETITTALAKITTPYYLTIYWERKIFDRT